ncbi:hypothetical protein [Hymenobacter sp. GOD-10R]|uniref:hypothetical protein n=1 Tax=Hymenobacter sp. GOD-10R TaxID=3093922 RepID=UPI002D7A01DA|nr:hypothetical protein [Hymenobacter sp. GOD-10R]WRQ28369.1 hypothetical protein SD425_25190 [Hymenobacter sp. GOD-10R]
MMNQLYKRYFPQHIFPSLFILIPLSSCIKSEHTEPEPTVPAQYEVTDVHYFLTPGARIDTVAVPLKGLSVQNPSNILATQQIEASVDDLVKTSQFEIDQTSLLPKEIDLSNLVVPVPQDWAGMEAVSYSTETFPLSAIQQQKPYGTYAKQILTIKIPANSRIDISRQIEAYHLTCSFQGTLKNTTTGQRYALRGTWKGLLRYNNLSTTTRQSTL